ncbi:MAG TPA: AMP-binding protein, partial [Phenylobacterium sp.]|nr:AMP-binding protein [Phenylobacterium sp.]
MNLYDVLAAGFPADRSKPAFLLSDGSAVSYGELEAGAAQVAGHLVAQGVEPGDRVGLQAEKAVEGVMVYLGVLKAGAVFLPLNAAYTAAEVDYFVKDAEPRLFLTDPRAFVAEALGAEPLTAAVARADDDLASLIYTSG